MAMLMFEVKENPNCEGMPQLIFNTMAAAKEITHVKTSRGPVPSTFHRITGWTSEAGGTPCPVYAVKVEESGSGVGWLVYGGDWGVRIMAPGAQAWSVDGRDQWGEPYLLLNDESEVRYS